MKVARLRTEHGAYTVVAGNPGRLYTQFVIVDSFPVRLAKISNAEFARYASDIKYPLKKACRYILRIGRQQGINKGAKALLREGLA